MARPYFRGGNDRKRERGILGGINKFKINNCWLTRVYWQRDSGVQEDHRRKNPSKGNKAEHHWHCYSRHRMKVREDDGKAIISTPPPAAPQSWTPHLHRQISRVDKRDAPLPVVSPRCAMSRPCGHLISRATSSSPHPLLWRGHRGYSSWVASFKQASKKGPMSRSHRCTPQVRLQARHPMVVHHGNQQEAFWMISSSEAPSNAPPGGTSGEPSEGLRGDSPSKE